MKDWRNLNVYAMNKFELLSKQRDARFRFIKYTGKNYKEVCDYIHELSPNTQVWEEYLLIPGMLYTFSGRTFAFNSVHSWNIRCCIANNPFIIIDGKEYPLSLTQEEAESYLHSTEGQVFCYDNICCDYIYNEAQDKYFIYDKNHPKGLFTKKLASHDEWYIGGKDGLMEQGYKFTPKYQEDTHTVHLDYDLRDLVDRIQKTIYNINKTRRNLGESEIFMPSFEDSERYKLLYKKCVDNSMVANFVQVLYNIVFESTKLGYATRGRLPWKLKEDSFVELVGEYRNHFSHGNAEYQAPGKIKISDIYLKYIHTSNEPQNATDFETIQIEMLNDFEDFVNRVLNVVLNDITVYDQISYDKKINVVNCNNVKLPIEFKDFVGCKCSIKKVINNNRPSDKLIYYSTQVSSIELTRSGVLKVDDSGNCSCEGIRIPKYFSKYKDCKIDVYKIKAFLSQGILYKNALTFRVSLPKPIIGDLSCENDRPVVKNYYLSKSKWGDLINKNTYKVEIRTITCYINDDDDIQEIADGAVIEGVIERIKFGLFVCGNVQLKAGAARQFEGQRIKINKFTINKNIKHKSNYPFYSEYFEVKKSKTSEKTETTSKNTQPDAETRPIKDIFKELGQAIFSKIKNIRIRRKTK